MAEDEKVAQMDNQASPWNARRTMIFIIALAMALFHMYTAGVRPLGSVQQRSVHLSFALALIFLLFPFRTRSDESRETKTAEEFRPITVVDIILVLLSFSLAGYVIWEYEALSFRVGMPNFLDSLCAFLGIVLLLEATRRIIGWSMVIIALVGFAYLALGTHLPTCLANTGFTFEEVINFTFFSTEGVLGPPLGVSAGVIVVFIIFGSFLLMSGAGSFFIDVGLSLFGRFQGGPAKAAVLGSCMFGMITGSQVANVAAVGVLTIPLLKRVGYRPIVAASVEALASTGAMLVPPVMGATAFIIPEMVGGTYWDVCKAALIPGLLFYVSVYMVVELQAAKYRLVGLPREELPSIRRTFLDRGHMILPILVLVFSIAVMGLPTARAGFLATVACVIVCQFRSATRMNLRKIATALERGAKACLIVAACCASAGLLTAAMSISGMGMRFSDALVSLAGGNVTIMLLLTMLASLILGLPLPPVSCYLILAVLAAPALVKAGIYPMAAHLFIFFFGTLGNISPPVAPTSYTAAGLAGTDPVKTTNLTFLYSLPAFFVPYMYIYSNELLLVGSVGMIVFRVLASFIGISCMAITFHGYLFRNMGWAERILFFAGGLAMIYPYWLSVIAGFIFIGSMAAWQIVTTRNGQAREQSLEKV